MSRRLLGIAAIVLIVGLWVTERYEYGKRIEAERKAAPAKAVDNGPRRYVLYAAQRREVEGAVAAVLKDPESARFSPIQAFFDGKVATRVCGTVNAKNSFGGYVGARPFFGVITGNTFQLWEIAKSDRQSAEVLNTCAKYGIIP